jgi:hypothetical protein
VRSRRSHAANLGVTSSSLIHQVARGTEVSVMALRDRRRPAAIETTRTLSQSKHEWCATSWRILARMPRTSSASLALLLWDEHPLRFPILRTTHRRTTKSIQAPWDHPHRAAPLRRPHPLPMTQHDQFVSYAAFIILPMFKLIALLCKANQKQTQAYDAEYLEAVWQTAPASSSSSPLRSKSSHSPPSLYHGVDFEVPQTGNERTTLHPFNLAGPMGRSVRPLYMLPQWNPPHESLHPHRPPYLPTLFD